MIPKISVTMVTGGSAALLRGCVESLCATAGELPVEIIVVDNCAGYNVSETLRGLPVVILRNERQLGLASNENRAIRHSRGEYIFWLNDDTLVQPGCMQHLLEVLERDPRLGAAVPRLFDDAAMRYPQANIARDFPKPFTCFLQDVVEETPLLGTSLGRRLMRNFYPLERSGPVRACGGAAILFRRKAIEAIGPMDEEYGMYYEETDWCRRLRDAGWGIFGVAEARVVHFGGQTTRTRADHYAQMQRRSRVRYLRKFHPWQTFFWMRLALPFTRRVLQWARPGRRRQNAAAPSISDQLASLARRIKHLQGGQPLTYLDIGSAAADGYWNQLARSGAVDAVYVDMADDWGVPSSGGSIRHVKAGLGARNEPAEAFITAHPGCSSCLPPNQALLKGYPVHSWFEVVSTQPVQLRRFEDLAAELGLPIPQVVKIDVQGLEGSVLQGFGQLLGEVLCLEFECQLKPLYEGQQLFWQLYPWLNEQGFILRDLKPQGPFEGEALEFNSFWSRRPATEAERLIVQLWERANQVWPGVDFGAMDQHERSKFNFNQRPGP